MSENIPLRPCLECPQCGSGDVIPLVARLNERGRTMAQRLVLVVGLPSSFPPKGEQGRTYLADLRRQGLYKELDWDPKIERPTWWCTACETAIVSVAPNNEELLAQAWEFIQATFVPASDDVKEKLRRLYAFNNFVATIVPQAVLEGASAIRVNESAFLIDGEWVQMVEFRDLYYLLGAIRRGHLPSDINFAEGQSVIVPTHNSEYSVTLRPTSLANDCVELELIDHNYPEAFLRDYGPRERRSI